MALTTNNYWQQESNIFVLVFIHTSWSIVTITTNAIDRIHSFFGFLRKHFPPKICVNLCKKLAQFFLTIEKYVSGHPGTIWMPMVILGSYASTNGLKYNSFFGAYHFFCIAQICRKYAKRIACFLCCTNLQNIWGESKKIITPLMFALFFVRIFAF